MNEIQLIFRLKSVKFKNEDKRIQKQFRQVKTRMQFYEKDLSMKPKGFFQV